jgi:hypothetical protein
MGPISFDGGVTGLGLADFLLGKVFEYRQFVPIDADVTQLYVGTYAQDTWRMNSNVTLNYGLRWEPWFPQESQDNRVYNFDINRLKAGTRSTVYPQSYPGLYYPGDPGFPTKSGMKRQWANMDPRVGISWDPSGDGRSSLRAGYGITSDFVTGQFLFDSRSAPPNGLEQRLVRPTLDDPWGSVGRTNPFPVDFSKYPYDLALYSLYISIPSDLKTTRNHSWNVGYQQQLGSNTAVSATYIGSHMIHMWGAVDGNPGVAPNAPIASVTSPCTVNLPGGGTQSFPNCSAALDQRRELSLLNPAVGQYFGYLDYVTDAGWQNYNGLLLSAQRRAGHGIALSANYTVSQCEGLISQGDAPLNVATGYMIPISMINPPSKEEQQKVFDREKGYCTNWRRHIFNGTATIQSPDFQGAALRAVASGWRLSGVFRASSGGPFTVSTGVDRALSGIQTTTQRPDQVLDDPYGDGSINNYLNAKAFAQPAIGTYGNAGRNAYFGPGSKSLDLSLVRQLSLSSQHQIEVRVEAFNALNWTRYGNPVANLSSSSFGRIQTLSGDMRVMQFALKYIF